MPVVFIPLSPGRNPVAQQEKGSQAAIGLRHIGAPLPLFQRESHLAVVHIVLFHFHKTNGQLRRCDPSVQILHPFQPGMDPLLWHTLPLQHLCHRIPGCLVHQIGICHRFTCLAAGKTMLLQRPIASGQAKGSQHKRCNPFHHDFSYRS